MALTINVILDDSDVQRFIDLYNEDAGTDITVDILNQNSDLQEAIGSDMLSFWFEALENDQHASTYDLYNDCIDDILLLPGDPVFDNENNGHKI